MAVFCKGWKGSGTDNASWVEYYFHVRLSAAHRGSVRKTFFAVILHTQAGSTPPIASLAFSVDTGNASYREAFHGPSPPQAVSGCAP